MVVVTSPSGRVKKRTPNCPEIFEMARRAIRNARLLVARSRMQAAEPSSFLSPAKKTATVVAVHDSQATDAFRAQPDRIRAMVERGLTNLTMTASSADAWRTLVSTQDVVGIKVFSTPGPNSGTRPAVVEALVNGLIS